MGALFFVIVNTCAHLVHAALFHFYIPDAPVRAQTSERAYMTAIHSSPGLCHPGESGHTEVCYQWSKASPLILFHVKQKGLNTAPDLKLWQWNIPGEKRDTFVWKGALRLPECFCLFIRLLKLLQPVLYWGRDKETEDKKARNHLCESGSFRSYLYRGRRRWPQVTLSILPPLSLVLLLFMPPRLI